MDLTIFGHFSFVQIHYPSQIKLSLINTGIVVVGSSFRINESVHIYICKDHNLVIFANSMYHNFYDLVLGHSIANGQF